MTIFGRRAKISRNHWAFMGRVVNILLVEDSYDDAFLFSRCTPEAVKVLHVISAGKAVEYLEREPLPDLIVMDLVLPGMSVNEFLGWFRANQNVRKIPIVLYTGRSRIPADLAGAVFGTFFKSVALEELRANVSEMLTLVA